MTADGTVEWGEDRRTGWLDRLLGEADSTGRRRVSTPALGCAVVAAALLLGSVLAPWMVGTVPSASPLDTTDGPRRDFHLEEVANVTLIAYQGGWLVLLALVGLALVVQPSWRRLVVAAGLGWGAALLMIVAGVVREITTGADEAFGVAITDTSSGPGAFFGLAGVVTAMAAFVLAGWQPGLGARRRRGGGGDDEPEEDPGPPDLTVTPLQ